MPRREIMEHTGAGAERVRTWVLKNQVENYDAEHFAEFEEKTREEFATSMKKTFDRIGVLIGDGKRYLDPLIKKSIGESIQRYRH